MVIASNCDLVYIIGVIIGYKIFWLGNIISKVPISSRTGVPESNVINHNQRYLKGISNFGHYSIDFNKHLNAYLVLESRTVKSCTSIITS